MIRQHPLTEQLLTTLVQTAEKTGPREHAMVILMSRHFFRVSELTGFKVADVNLRDNTIRINRLKGSISTVEAMLPGDREAIVAWLAVKPKSEFMFPGQEGQRMHRGQMYRIFRTLSEESGMPEVSRAPHAMRHTLGQRMAERGAPAKLIQQSAGHKNLNSTSQYFEFRQSFVDGEKAKLLGLA